MVEQSRKEPGKMEGWSRGGNGVKTTHPHQEAVMCSRKRSNRCWERLGDRKGSHGDSCWSSAQGGGHRRASLELFEPRRKCRGCEDMGAGPAATDNGEKVEELVASFGEVRTVKSR